MILANYLYGLTGVPFCQYLLASLWKSTGGIAFLSARQRWQVSLDAIASGHIAGGAGQIFLLALSVLVTIGGILLLPRLRATPLRIREGDDSFVSSIARPQKS